MRGEGREERKEWKYNASFPSSFPSRANALSFRKTLMVNPKHCGCNPANDLFITTRERFGCECSFPTTAKKTGRAAKVVSIHAVGGLYEE